MVILSYYVSGIIATFMLSIFYNLLTNDPLKEFSMPQILASAFAWPLILPLAVLGGIVRLYQYIFKTKQ